MDLYSKNDKSSTLPWHSKIILEKCAQHTINQTEQCSHGMTRQFLVTNNKHLIENKPQNCEP